MKNGKYKEKSTMFFSNIYSFTTTDVLDHKWCKTKC